MWAKQPCFTFFILTLQLICIAGRGVCILCVLFWNWFHCIVFQLPILLFVRYVIIQCFFYCFFFTLFDSSKTNDIFPAFVLVICVFLLLFVINECMKMLITYTHIYAQTHAQMLSLLLSFSSVFLCRSSSCCLTSQLMRLNGFLIIIILVHYLLDVKKIWKS